MFTIKELPPTLDINELAVLLKRSASTINKDLQRAPSRVPPPSPTHTAGARRIWITSHVLDWLDRVPGNQPKQKAKRGHPGKVAQVRRMQAEGGRL